MLSVHLLPFFGNIGLSQITPGKVQDYRIHRIKTNKRKKPPARSTMHDEVESWLAKFEHWDKWNFCLNSAMMPANRSDHDETHAA